MYGAYGVSDGVLSDPGPGMMLPEEPLEGPEDLSLMPKTWSDIDLDEIEQTAILAAASLSGGALQVQDSSAPQRGNASDVPIAASTGEATDPLGLGTIDLTALRVSLEPGLARQPSMLPGLPRTDGQPGAAGPSSLLPTSKDFDPDAYIGLVHVATSRARLEAGIKGLSEQLSERTAQLRALVRDNFTRFMSCKEAIDGIYAHLRVGDSGGVASTKALLETVEMAERSARKTLEPLLERQQQSVAVRDSMATLRKHSAAAFLPSRLLHRVEAGRVADLEAALEDFRASMPLVPASGGRVWVGVAEESREALFHVALGAQVDMCRAEMSADDVTRLLRLLHGIASELGPGAYEMRAMDGSARGAAVTESVLSGGGEERRARSAVEEAGSALSREPGRLLMRSVGEGCVRRMRRVRDKGRRAAERMRKDGSPGQVRVRALVQAAVQVTQAMTAAICRLWTLANAPGVVHWASQFPVGSGKGPQPATSARSSLDGTRAGVAASERPYASQTLYNTQGSSTLPPGFLSPGPKRPARMALRRQTSVPTQPLRGAPDDAPPRSAKEAQGEGELKRPLGLAPRVVQRLRELSSVSAQSLSRTGSAIAALTCDPMGAETAMQQLIDEFEVVAKSIIEETLRSHEPASDAVASASALDAGGSAPDMGALSLLIRSICASRRQLLAAGMQSDRDLDAAESQSAHSTAVSSHAITKTLRVPAEAVDSMDAILKSLVEAAGEGASARMRAVADAAFVDSPALCASALAQGIHGTAATALLALSEEAWGPDARATSALALQLEGTPLHDPGGDAGAEPTALVAWLRGTIRAAICSVEAAAREALAGETGLLFSMEALAQAVWEVVERAAEFVEMCSTIGAAPPGPNPGLTQPDSIDVGSPEWALASLRTVEGLESLCDWAETRMAPLRLHQPDMTPPGTPQRTPSDCLAAIARAREALMGLFTDGASSRLRRLVAEWVASLARVPALPTDGMHAAGRAGGGGEVRRGSTAASTRGGGSDGGWGVEVRAWAVPCGARWEARVVLDYLANIRGSLAPHARDEQRDVLTKLTEVVFKVGADTVDDLVRGTLQAQPLRDGVRKRTGGQEGAEGGRERDGGEAWVVQRGVSVCGYCQLRLELDVIDEATASLHGRGVGKHLGRMLEGMGKAVVVTDEDIALLGIEQEDGTRGAELVAEKVYASIARELLPRELERAGILLDCLRL